MNKTLPIDQIEPKTQGHDDEEELDLSHDCTRRFVQPAG